MDEGSNHFEFGYVSNETLFSPDSTEILFKLAQRAERKDILEEKDVQLPMCVFREGHSALRAVVKYLKEQKNLSFVDIATLLLRDQRTVWSSYNSVQDARKFRQEKLWAETDFVPVSVLRNRELSVLEAISTHLKKSHSNADIAKLLGKSPKTVWTVINRAKNKRRRPK